MPITVGDLKAMLDSLPDDLVVLVEGGSDHRYLSLSSGEVTDVGRVGKRGRPVYFEWYGEENASPGEIKDQGFVFHF